MSVNDWPCLVKLAYDIYQQCFTKARDVVLVANLMDIDMF